MPPASRSIRRRMVVFAPKSHSFKRQSDNGSKPFACMYRTISMFIIRLKATFRKSIRPAGKIRA